jgi:chromatin modification-related protein EAF6
MDLKEQEKQLLELIAKRAMLERNLGTIESQIYTLEHSYLEETPFGNIVRGFEGYTTARTRRGRTVNADRIFSKSSVNFKPAESCTDSEDSDKYVPTKRRRFYE